MGQNAANCVERINSSEEGISPANPPISKPQNGFPEIFKDNPAVI